jgi:hypothetical protein
MSEQKLSKDITPQEDAVEIIENEDFESVEALEAFTEGDERKKVQEAVTAKGGELAEAGDPAVVRDRVLDPRDGVLVGFVDLR